MAVLEPIWRKPAGLDNLVDAMWTGALSGANLATEHYEVCLEDAGSWRLKSLWRDFEVAWAAARVHARPVRIVRAKYACGEEVEREIVVELGVTRDDAEPELRESDLPPAA